MGDHIATHEQEFEAGFQNWMHSGMPASEAELQPRGTRFWLCGHYSRDENNA
jgi:hypothetical protein